MSLNSTFAKSIFNTERFQTDNNLLKDGQTATSTDKSKTDGKNPIIGKATVSLENKPPEMPLGEHLKRQALNKIAADYGLRSEDVELEIQYIKEKSGGNFINDLNFGETQVKNPNDLTDLQVADLIKNGHKTVEFGIHQATIERMVKRDELVKWLAQKDALNISMSEEDVADLKNLGYTPSDVAKIRDAKYMQYWGLREKALADVNEIAKQKLIADRIEELEKNPEQVIKEGDNTTSSRVEFLIRTTATREINDALTNSKMTPLEYTADKKSFEQSLAELRAWEKKVAQAPISTYAKEGLKNGINGVYWSIGETLKGAAVLGNALRRYDEDGNKLDTKASDALLYKAGDWTQKTINLPVDKDIERTLFGGIIPKTVGGVLPYLFGSWATATPRATTAVLAGLSTGGATYDEAKTLRRKRNQRAKLRTFDRRFYRYYLDSRLRENLESLKQRRRRENVADDFQRSGQRRRTKFGHRGRTNNFREWCSETTL